MINSVQGRSVGFVIQRYVKPKYRGEFGNLYRISKTRDHWEISTLYQDGSTGRQRVNSQRDRAADPETTLGARRGVSRERVFGEIGAWLNRELLSGIKQRMNCEWIDDQRGLYLVQIDGEDEDVRGVNPSQLRVCHIAQCDAHSGTYLKHANNRIVPEWDKLRVLNELWEPAETDKPSLFVLKLSEITGRGGVDQRAALEADFRHVLGESDIVVRTSIRAGMEKIPNLPRSEGLSPEAAADWCVRTADQLTGEHEASSMAFIVHRFVEARASAWVRADPNDPMVEIHALWGLPDALQFCPYDIWEVHVPTGVATDYPEYKSDMLMSQPDGSWRHGRVKNELARHNCISAKEAKELAARSALIARRLGRSCHIMWFVGCVAADGRTFSLPWYWTHAHRTEANHDRTNYKIITVSNEGSLENCAEWQGGGKCGKRCSSSLQSWS